MCPAEILKLLQGNACARELGRQQKKNSRKKAKKEEGLEMNLG
jgi:hypothetical protein